jgi:hypothetical protein
MSLFTIPLVVLSLLAVLLKIKNKNYDFKKNSFSLLLTAGVVVYLIISTLLLIYFDKNLDFIIPNIDWHFEYLRALDINIRFIISILTFIGSIIYSRTILTRYIINPGWKKLADNEKLLSLVTLFLLLINIFYYQLGDKYLLALLPFILITIGNNMKFYLEKFNSTIIILCLVLMIVPIFYTKKYLEIAELYWRAGEILVSRNIDPNIIFNNKLPWDLFYNYQDYVMDVENNWHKNKFDPITHYRENQYPLRKKRAKYLVISDVEFYNKFPPNDWVIIEKINHKILSINIVVVIAKKKK